jgi:hypothetical protein
MRTHAAVIKFKKVMTNPGSIKKACQLTYKSIALYNLVKETIVCVGLVKGLKGVVDVIDFYGTYKNIVFWINPFSKQSIDRESLKRTLTNSMLENNSSKSAQETSDFVDAVVKRVFEKPSYRNANEVRTELTLALIQSGIDAAAATNIASRENVSIKQQSRPVTSLIIGFCFTVGDLMDNIVTLKKYGILDYTILTGKIAASVGNNSRVFTFFYELGAGTIIGTLNSIGLLFVVGSVTYKLIVTIRVYMDEGDQERKAELWKEIKATGGKLLVTTIDFAVCVAPLVFSINPGALIAMAIVSKGVGLIYAFVK